jgi:hypothetical protein
LEEIDMASGKDLFGTWKQDSARSAYSPGPKAKTHTRVYEKSGKGFKVSCEETIRGKTVSWNYTAPAYDGKIYPVHGREDANGIKSYKLSETETLGIFTKDGMEVAGYRRDISIDGKTLTVIESGADNGAGKPYWNVSVFTKAE